MKRLLVVLLVLSFILTAFTGCNGGNNNSKKDDKSKTNNAFKGNIDKDRILYKDVDFDDYVKVGNYLGVTVDTKSVAFEKVYEEVFTDDIAQYELYKSSKEVVESGDTVIIDYVGKIDGVAFAGGTAEGAELRIGSKTYIDDFEDELIGMKPGETKDVTAKFPDDYHEKTLAGKESIFTVNLRYINTKALTEEESFEKVGFDTLADYQKDLKERAVKQYLLDDIVSKSQVIDYPQEDIQIMGDAIISTYMTYYDVSLDEFSQIISNQGYTLDSFVQELSTQMMGVNMIMYYIFDDAELEMLEDKKGNEGITEDAIIESHNVQYTVLEYLYENAKIK